MATEGLIERGYHVLLVSDATADGHSGWVAQVEEFPGCISQGATIEEAVEGVTRAAVSWVEAAEERGLEIPAPREPRGYSGRFVLRVPSSLHGALARQAAEDGVSLNQFATAALAAAVGWRTQAAGEGRMSTNPVDSRYMRRAQTIGADD
jgi:antitoxin HicB